MANSRKNKDKPLRRPDSQRRRLRAVLRVVVALAAVAAVPAGLYALRAKLLASAPYAHMQARVRLTALPAWMPDDIAQDLAAQLQSVAAGRTVFDGPLARDVHDRAAASPWIMKVNGVTKHGDGAVVV
ncbi:MAG: hypothetical protein AMJ81_11285, partial [Phycisphaerae bacterium SM23_33]